MMVAAASGSVGDTIAPKTKAAARDLSLAHPSPVPRQR